MNKTNKDKMIKAIFFDIDGTLHIIFLSLQ